MDSSGRHRTWKAPDLMMWTNSISHHGTLPSLKPLLVGFFSGESSWDSLVVPDFSHSIILCQGLATPQEKKQLSERIIQRILI